MFLTRMLTCRDIRLLRNELSEDAQPSEMFLAKMLICRDTRAFVALRKEFSDYDVDLVL